MHFWRATFIHLSFLLAQPAYLTIRHLLGDEVLKSRSILNLTIHIVIWVYIATRISLPFFTSPLRYVPSPAGEKFPMGHLHFHRVPPTSLIEDMVNNTPNDGLLAMWGPLYLGSEVIATRPDTISDMLNAHSYDWEKPPAAMRVFERFLGRGLLSAEGSEHHAMRRTVAPAFTGRNMRDLAPLFYAKGLALVEVIARQAKEAENRAVEVTDLFSRVTLDIIGVAGIGMQLDTLNKEDSLLAKLYYEVAHPPGFYLLIDSMLPRWFTDRLGLTRTSFGRTIEAQRQLRQEVRNLMEKKRQQMHGEESSPEGRDIIAIITKSGDLSDDHLVSHMLTFLAAGHDTTASALMWATWLLSKHPEIQHRLRSECKSLLEEVSGAAIDASLFDAESSPLLTAVCNETLRLYPPVTISPRYAVRSTTIGGVRIPDGTVGTVGIWAVNRSRELWGVDADQFKPDRWLKGADVGTGGSKSPYAFLTFLHGPRSCIGQGFARLEMKCLLAALVVRFKFELAEPDQKVEIGGFLTIKPKDGMRLKVTDLKSEGD
jgi:cytochrome P450